jgi:hypothetical protein
MQMQNFERRVVMCNKPQPVSVVRSHTKTL